MKKKRRILQCILCCIIIATAVLFSIWFTTPLTDPVQIFRDAERRNLYKASEIMGFEELFFDFDYAVLGRANQGYLLYEWCGSPHRSDTGELQYYPRQEGITVFSSAGFISEHKTSHKSIPLFIISDNYRAVSAKITFHAHADFSGEAFEMEMSRRDGGYFLFHIPCDKLGCPSRLYFWSGSCTVELFDSSGQLLETHTCIPNQWPPATR